MAVRAVYAQMPTRLHRSFGRISAWLMALGLAANGLAALSFGVVSLLGLVDQRLSERAFAALSTFAIPYLLVSILLTAVGGLTFFVGRIVSHHRDP
jgi:hypothetical protein